MTREQLLRWYPRASKSFILRHCGPGGAEPEPVVRDEPLGSGESPKASGRRFQVRVTCLRHRLLDEDNQCPKSLIDQLRYFQLIPDDSPKLMEYQVIQEKIPKTQKETTTLTVTVLPETI